MSPSFVGRGSDMGTSALYIYPLLFRIVQEQWKELKPFVITVYTHTPGRAGKTLKGKRKKKADTRRADGQKTAQGGEANKRTSGTNLHGETDLTKTAHTPKPHDTLRRGTRGKLGTKWGTSWWQTRKPKQLIKNRTQFLTTWKSCVIPLPGPWSSLPQLAKTAFKFQRIRCTIWFNHKKQRGPHLKVVCLPATFLMVMFHRKSWSCRENEVSDGFDRFHSDRKAIWRGTLGQPDRRDFVKRCTTVRPTVALYLDELPD